MAQVVHHRVALEDHLKIAKECQTTLKKAEEEYKKVKDVQEPRRLKAVKEAQIQREQMEVAEGILRESLLKDAIVDASKPSVVEEPAEIEEEAMDIGRAE